MRQHSRILSVARSIAISAVVWALPCAARADLTGLWDCDAVYLGNHYPQDVGQTESGGIITGTSYTHGTSTAFATITGTASGNSFHTITTYITGSYVSTADGTFSGDTMSGTFSSNTNQTGTFSCTRISTNPYPGGVSPTPTPGSGKRPTKLTLFCNRNGVLLENADCAATVADAGPQPVSLPTGTITFEATNGFFPGAGSCNPVQTSYSPGIGSCKAVFSVPNGFPLGAKFPISAAYSGDSTFDPSSTSHKLIAASCVGTPERPCKNSIGLDFDEIPRVIQDAIDAILLCGGVSKQQSGSLIQARRQPLKCVLEAASNLDLVRALVGLTPDQFRSVASKLTSSQAAGNLSLLNFRTLATTLTDAQLAKILDPNERQGGNAGLMFRALQNGKYPTGLRSAPLKAKKKANPYIRVGKLKAKLSAGTQKEVTFHLSNTAKILVEIFKNSDFKTLPLRITVTGTRSDSEKVKTIKGTADVGLE